MDNKMVMELLKEMRQEQIKQGNCLSAQVVCISNIEKNVDINTKNLEKHMDRTRAVERNNEILTELHLSNQIRIEKNETRIEKLEIPVKVREYISKRWVKISATVIGVLTIVSLTTKILGYW